MTKREFVKLAMASGLSMTIAREGYSGAGNSLTFGTIKTNESMKAQNFQSAFIEIIKDATRAPSGHNTQPWKFQVNGSQIILTPDYSRRLTIVDPDDHALFISLGCALENLSLSAKAHGFTPTVTMNFQNGQDEIDCDLKKSDIEPKDPLYEAIYTRQCTRNKYDPTPIDQYILDQMVAGATSDAVEVILFTDRQQIKALEPFIIEGSNLQFENEQFVDELVSWIRFNKKKAEANGDGLWASSTGSPNVPKFIGRMAVKNFTSAKSEAKRWKNLIEKTAGFALFVAKENTKTNWVQLGRSFQRFGLKATQLGINHAHVNMPCEEMTVRKKMAAHLNLDSAQPLLLIRFGYSEKMPYSFRRPVEEVLA